jgi:signal transduction histidine kinase
LFRIAQEALTNVAKHSKATRASVELEMQPTRVFLEVHDDGCGFDPRKALATARKQSGWGLLGIQERTWLLGGQYEIDSAPGKGTRIRVEVPLTMEKSDAKNTLVAG